MPVVVRIICQHFINLEFKHFGQILRFSSPGKETVQQQHQKLWTTFRWRFLAPAKSLGDRVEDQVTLLLIQLATALLLIHVLNTASHIVGQVPMFGLPTPCFPPLSKSEHGIALHRNLVRSNILSQVPLYWLANNKGLVAPILEKSGVPTLGPKAEVLCYCHPPPHPPQFDQLRLAKEPSCKTPGLEKEASFRTKPALTRFNFKLSVYQQTLATDRM